MKKILVTGASGFVGRYCLNILTENGFDVHATHYLSRQVPDNSIKWYKLDLMNTRDLSDLLNHIRPTHLLHLAWVVTPGKWSEVPENYYWVQASLELLKKFIGIGGRRCLFVGSGLEYDWKYGYCNEELTPKNPATFYGICKNSLRELCESYSKLNEVSFAWGRLFFLYGPYEDPRRLVAYVIRQLLTDEEARCSSGNQIRDFLHAYDAARALITVLDSNFEGSINIASGEPVKLKDIVLKVANKLGKGDLVRLGAIPAALSDTDLIVADTNKLSNEFRWKPSFTLDDGLDDTIDWWKKRTEYIWVKN